MRKDEIVSSMAEELAEECESKFKAYVKQCLRDINSISHEMRKLEASLIEKRKELAEMEFTPFKVEL